MVPSALKPGPLADGRLARYRGAFYRAVGIDANGVVGLGHTGLAIPPQPPFTYVAKGEYWSADVPADECDPIATISHRATYRGHPCTVVRVDDTGVGLHLIGDQATATDLGFDVVERGVYWKNVDFADLDDYYEVRSDLYFPYWQRSTFGFRLGPSNWRDHVPDPDLPDVAYPRFRLGRFTESDAPDEPGRPVDVTVVATYQGDDYQVVGAWPGGHVTLSTNRNADWAAEHGFTEAEPGRFEKRVHVGLLYGYREIHRNLLFDAWLADVATGPRP